MSRYAEIRLPKRWRNAALEGSPSASSIRMSDHGAALVAGGATNPAKMLPAESIRSHPDEKVRNLAEK